MGINIFPYILGERKEGYIETTSYDDFDDMRYTGDRQFAATDEIEWEEVLDNPDGRSIGEVGYDYNRPKDIDKAIEWVKANVYEGNQRRLIDLLGAMKENKNLYVYFSY